MKDRARHILYFLGGGLLVSLALAAALLSVWMHPPNSDLRSLLFFMAGSGLVTITLAFTLYRFGILRRLPSLRWALIGSTVLTVLLLVFNVWFTAHQMFFDVEHDLILMIVLLVFGGMLAVIFGSFIANMLTDSIHDLTDASRELAGGNLKARVPIKGRDELAQLARTFNAMLDTLQEVETQKQQLEETRRNLIAGISHDLRTPLTSMRVMVEALQDGLIPDDETRQRYLANIIHEIEHLSRWVNDLFELAQLELGAPSLHYEHTSLRDLFSDTLSSLRAQAERRQLRLESEITAGLDTVYLAPDKFQRVLNNLLANAIAHTPPEGRVILRADQDERTLRLSVHNTGSVIAAEHLPKLFQRFYRGDPARESRTEGQRSAGLGLAIAKGFVEAHGGEIWANSVPGEGTTFHFTIPEAA